MAGEVQVLGLHELDNTLSLLSGEIAGPAMRSGLGAAATKIKKVVRANVNATPILISPGTATREHHPGSIKRAARKSIGHSIKRDRTAGYLLKVGFGVGFKGERGLRRLSEGTTTGKGISARNIVWFVVGTKSSKRPGRIQPTYAGVLRASVMDAQTTATNTLRAKVWERVRILAARKRRRAWAQAAMQVVRGV